MSLGGTVRTLDGKAQTRLTCLIITLALALASERERKNNSGFLADLSEAAPSLNTGETLWRIKRICRSPYQVHMSEWNPEVVNYRVCGFPGSQVTGIKDIRYMYLDQETRPRRGGGFFFPSPLSLSSFALASVLTKEKKRVTINTPPSIQEKEKKTIRPPHIQLKNERSHHPR